MIVERPGVGRILLRLDDQILIDPHQFSVLIRNRKDGDEISLTYLRAGKQATARVKLGKEALYASALKGKGAMPPRGGNDRLSESDVRNAVDHMLKAVR